MGIGTSLGGFFNDEFELHASPYLKIDPSGEVLRPKGGMGKDDMIYDFKLKEPENDTPVIMDVANRSSDYVHKPQMWPKDSNFNTKLSPDLEAKYQQSFSPNDSQDYDMRGWYLEQYMNNPLKEVKTKGEGVHYPDTYKKPNHPTFSTESIYHNNESENRGGVWGEEDGKDTFTPSSTNLKNMSKEDLQAYFNKVEPNAILKLPKPDIEDRREEDYKPTIEDKIVGDGYLPETNKLLENRLNTKLEKEAGADDLDKAQLDQIIKLIQKGMALKDKK